MSRLISIIAVSMLLLFSIAAQAQIIHYYQNFDGLVEGTVEGQDGWATGPPATVNETATTITSDVFHGDFGKSMQVDPFQVVIREFDPTIKSGIHFTSLWFRYELQNVSDDKLFVYYGEEVREWAGGPNCYIGGGSDPNKVSLYKDGAWIAVGENILVGEWQHFFQVIDIDNQKHDLYIDDVLVAEDCDYRNPGNHKALGWIMFGFDRGKMGTIGYYDDVVIGEGDQLIEQAVAPEDKLASTWGHLKNAR